MAEKLDTFPADRGHGPRGEYPWDEWLDGSVWKLQTGTDFPGQPRHFSASVYKQGRYRGKKVRCAMGKNVGEGVLVIQAYLPFNFTQEA